MLKVHNGSDFKPMSLMSLLLSFISVGIVIYLLLFLVDQETRHTLLGIDTAICVLFLLQLTIDCCRSEHKLDYLKSHWLDIIASIPFIEILRIARIWHIVRMLSLFRYSTSFIKQVKQNRKEATLATIFTLLIILVCSSSIFMLMFERDAINSNIHTAGDALWWSLVTISTVGYGDYYPVTFGGKVLATAMIICGVGIFGMISGLITSILTLPVKTEAEDNHVLQQLLSQQQTMLDKIEHLEQQLQQKSRDQ
ncbi:ion transporter [Vibrio algivorus]|uniref:Capsular polysaccharide biosynthesis protein n=1 Tax=Vibrio algivorus TaxID=1667024 RepID=A0ABQ6EPR4_9VIBR|nr:ion transporter [Vibrio algivorus]GLT15108.1 capsular polysaccharide biosynthesis protein [Vibrio algivorus]